MMITRRDAAVWFFKSTDAVWMSEIHIRQLTQPSWGRLR